MRNLPVHVIRTGKDGSRRRMVISQDAWKRIVEKPHLAGGKWELAKVAEIDKPIKDTDLDVYNDQNYKEDNALGKKLREEGKLEEALIAYERAYEFKPSPYYRGIINKLKDEISISD